MRPCYRFTLAATRCQRGTTTNAKNLTAPSFKPLLERVGLPRSVRVHDLDKSLHLLFLILDREADAGDIIACDPAPSRSPSVF